MKKPLVFICILCSFVARAQTEPTYQSFRFIQTGDTLPYRILLPENFDSSRTYPLIVFLHGRGESGRDNQKQLTHGSKVFLTDSFRKQYPAIVVFPQCAANDYWSNVHTVANASGKRSFYFIEDGSPSRSLELAMELTRHLMEYYPVNRDQVYAMGLSMGGMGVFELVRRMPTVFAAAVPICGGAHPGTARQLRKVSWWVFHGAKDDVVLPRYSEEMVAALKKAKAQVRFTLYPYANHNSWDPAFAEPDLFKWLFSQRK